MLYYGVRTCSFIQFDYYGESMFIVSIFSEYAIECEYPEIAPENFFGSEICLEVDKRRYMESHGTIAHENRCLLLSFNGKMNIPEYYELVMEDGYICGNVTNLVILTVVLLVSYCFFNLFYERRIVIVYFNKLKCRDSRRNWINYTEIVKMVHIFS